MLEQPFARILVFFLIGVLAICQSGYAESEVLGDTSFTIEGVITNCGEGVGGYTITAIREVRVGFPLPPKPCVVSHPNIETVGTTLTGPDGDFTITCDHIWVPPDVCRFSEQVYITVLDGLTHLWTSPKKIATKRVTFDHELSMGCPDGSVPDGSAIVRGAISRCGVPAEGYHVVAFEETRAGFPTGFKPCQISLPNVRSVGTAVVGSDGSFTISFGPTEEIPGTCFFSSKVFIRVYEGPILVWMSSKKPAASVISFDHELTPDCPSVSSLVRVGEVIRGRAHRIEDAEVYVNGDLRGLTNPQGELHISPPLSSGDELAARKLIIENRTDREAHDLYSTQNWNYRVYITSLPLNYDTNGDHVSFLPHVVANPNEIQELQLSRQNVIIGLHLRASVEWDASDMELKIYQDRLVDASELIHNATDGQFLIEQLELDDDGAYWDEADIRIYANVDLTNQAGIGAFHRSIGYIRLNSQDAIYPGIVLHEFGHYGFHLHDEYAAGPDWDSANGNPRCTLLTTTPGTPFSRGGSKDSCFMSGSQFAYMKKLCSSHHLNPHARGTRQGDQDCWNVVLEKYGDAENWDLQTPVKRGVIVGRLPDHGTAPVGRTPPPPGTAPVESYIRVTGWKTKVSLNNTTRPNLCTGVIVKCMRDGQPMSNAEIYIDTAYGRTIYQGETGTRRFADGELAVRGLHVGDRIRAYCAYSSSFPSPFVSPFSAEHTVAAADCSAGMIELEMTTMPSVLSVKLEPTASAKAARVLIKADVALSTPPHVSLALDDSNEALSVPMRFEQNTKTYIGLINNLVDTRATFEVTAFGINRYRVTRTVDASFSSIQSETESTLVSADGRLKIIIPASGLTSPALSIVMATSEIPLSLTAGDELIAGPYSVSSSAGKGLRKPAMIYFELGDLGPPGENCGRSRRTLDILEYDRCKRRWNALGGTVQPDPGLVTAKISKLGTYMLVARSVKPAKAKLLFNGEDLSNWIGRDGGKADWEVSGGAMTVVKGKGDIMTDEKLADFMLHVEFMTPSMSKTTGEVKGDSGIYLQGRYEIQISDSYGIKIPSKEGCGAIYKQVAPLVNACGPPHRWQTYDVVFRAARVDSSGQVIEQARITVLHNGIVIHNNVWLVGVTEDALDDKEGKPGPLLLQGHGDPVKYRNIWIMPLSPKGSYK